MKGEGMKGEGMKGEARSHAPSHVRGGVLR